MFELLRRGPRSVGELAAELPVSRPAVSQHLRVLEDAGLVTHRKDGTRHLYGLNGNGVVGAPVLGRRILGRGARPLQGGGRGVRQRRHVMSESLVIEAVRKTVTVDCAVEEAFRVFTADAMSWWPIATHSIHGRGRRGARLRGARGRRGLRALGEAASGATGRRSSAGSRRRGSCSRGTSSSARRSPTEVEVRFVARGRRDARRARAPRLGGDRRGCWAQALELRQGLGPCSASTSGRVAG